MKKLAKLSGLFACAACVASTSAGRTSYLPSDTRADVIRRVAFETDCPTKDIRINDIEDASDGMKRGSVYYLTACDVGVRCRVVYSRFDGGIFCRSDASADGKSMTQAATPSRPRQNRMGGLAPK